MKNVLFSILLAVFVAGCATQSTPTKPVRPQPPMPPAPGMAIQSKIAVIQAPKKPTVTITVETNNQILSLCQRTAAPTVNVWWCPVIFTNGLAASGYKVYWGIGPTITNWQSNVYDTNVQCGLPITVGTNWCRCYSNSVDVGNTTNTTLTNIPVGVTVYFACTSYDVSNNESAYSEEVYRYIPQYLPLTNSFSVTITSAGPNEVQLIAKVCPDSLVTVQASPVIPPQWSVIATNQTPDSYGNFVFVYTVPSTNQMVFFRLALQ
jgi:uncharacterized lipoprotein YajG